MKVLDEEADDVVAGTMVIRALEAKVLKRRVREFARTGDGRKLLAERPSLQLSDKDLARLRALPAGTLGNLLARYYAEYKIQPFVSDFPVASDEEYLAKRYREIHDVVHLVTGYAADPMGEVELQAFILGNLRFRSSLLAIVYVAVVRPDGLPHIWKYADKLWAAYRRGRHSADVTLAPDYERYWASSINEVRGLFGLAPAL
jgi:ubiquinone biosynthesis protein COQ4